jgi:hypothetical protein
VPQGCLPPLSVGSGHFGLQSASDRQEPLSSQRFVRFDGPDRCWLVGVSTTGAPRAAKGAARGRGTHATGAAERRAAITCPEEDPRQCQRQLPIARVLFERRAGTSRGMGVGRRPRGCWHYRHFCEDGHDGQFRVALDRPTPAACLATCGLWQEPSRWRWSASADRQTWSQGRKAFSWAIIL